MNSTFHFAKRKDSFIFLVILLFCFTMTKSFCQTQEHEDDGYHPPLPKINRMPYLEPISQYLDKEEYLFLYEKRKYTKIESVTKLKNTTLLVVADSEESAMGKALEQVFSVYWKYTNYKFIKPSEVLNYTGKAGYSFFMFVRDEHQSSPKAPLPGTGPQTITNGHSSRPHLYYQLDTMQHIHGSYFSTYLFVICIPNGDSIKKDTKDDDVMESMSIADYINPLITDELPGSLLQKEKKAMSEFNTIVSNFQDDLAYIYKTKTEYTPVIIPISSKLGKLYVTYESQEIKCRTMISYYGDAQKLLKTRKILIDSSLADNTSIRYLAKIAEIDTSQIQLVNVNVINDSIEKRDENICYIENPCASCGTGILRICDTYGKKMVDFPGFVPRLEADLFNKNASPQQRKKIQIEMSK